MAAVAVREEVQQTILDASPPNSVELFHGYTYSAHPGRLRCRPRHAENLPRRGYFRHGPRTCPGLPGTDRSVPGPAIYVTDTRGFGLLGAVDLEPDGKPGARGYNILCKAFEKGLVLRAAGDTIVLAPPFAATAEEIIRMTEIMRAVIVAN